MSSQIFIAEGSGVKYNKLLTSFGAGRERNPLLHFSLSQNGINQGVTWKLVGDMVLLKTDTDIRNHWPMTKVVSGKLTKLFCLEL